MERVHYEDRDGVALIRLDDGKANALQGEFNSQFSAALDRAEGDDSVKAVLVTGRPGYFSAGLDLKTLPTLERSVLRETLLEYCHLMLRTHSFPKPMVAVISGHALAGGCVLLLGCDHRIGAGGPFRIGLNEVAIGVPLPYFVVEMARPALTPAALHEALLAGRAYDPEAAREAGYLHEVVEAQDAEAKGMEMARSLGALSRAAFSATKVALKGDVFRRGSESIGPNIDDFLQSLPFPT